MRGFRQFGLAVTGIVYTVLFIFLKQAHFAINNSNINSNSNDDSRLNSRLVLSGDIGQTTHLTSTNITTSLDINHHQVEPTMSVDDDFKTSWSVLGYNVSVLLSPSAACDVDRDDDDDVISDVTDREHQRPISDGDANTTSLILIVVHSSVSNREQRDAIRSTWGKTSWRGYLDYTRRPLDYTTTPLDHVVFVNYVFLLGSTADSRQMDKVRRESAVYKDLVVLDMADSYRNLSLKSLTGLHWAVSHCSRADYVLKVDDDVYLDVRQLTQDVRTDPRHYDRHGLLTGSKNTHSKVMRRGPWALRRDQHRADYFPNYCSGNSYLMSSHAAQRIIEASKGITVNVSRININSSTGFSPTENASDLEKNAISAGANNRTKADSHSDHDRRVQYVPFEDVLITGYLAKAGGLECQHNARFPLWFEQPSSSRLRALLDHDRLALHNVDYRQMYSIHETVERAYRHKPVS